MKSSRFHQEAAQGSKRLPGCLAWLALFALAMPCILGALEEERRNTPRKEVFEFTEKPHVTRRGDTIEITFTTREYCDATVAIEDAKGLIVRHLASGVLGSNPPPPFQKDSLKQVLIWNGKNDQGEYVDDKNSLAVRVSLGLNPRFERTLFWSPKKRTRSPRYLDANLLLAVADEGVYLYDGGSGDHIRLFDHQGGYVRTVYPPPAGQLKSFLGPKLYTFPQDGLELPLKTGAAQETFLDTEVRTMAAHGRRVVLAGEHLQRLAADGGTGGVTLRGPDVCVPTYVPGVHEWKGGVVDVSPTDMAFSPDGKWIYLAGYMWSRSWMHGVLNGVGRIAADGGGMLENFAGSLGEVSGSGRVEKSFTDQVKGNPLAPGQLGAAASVDVDVKGRVYVADHLNSRIRIYDAAGKPLQDIPVDHPALVRVSPITGEIYVFRYPLPVIHDKNSASHPAMIRLGGFDNPQVLATCALPTDSHARDAPPCRMAVDFKTTPPTIWMAERALQGYGGGAGDRPEKTCARLMIEENGKLVVKRDFGQEARREVALTRGARHMKQRLYFDPRGRRLYVGELVDPHPEHVTTMLEVAVINPDNGKVQAMRLPIDAEDMAFDLNGFIYLRGFDRIVRFDPTSWREVPFDYGSELASGSTFFSGPPIKSAVLFYSERGVASSQMGGMGVSPKGHVIISATNPERAPDLRADKTLQQSSVAPVVPQMFPGRARPWEVHVFDKHGHLVYQDAIPGIGRTVGLNMDAQDDLYVMICGVGRVGGEPYYNPFSASLVKLRPKTRILATSATIPLPDNLRPKRPPDLVQVDAGGSVWIDEGGYWIRGGVGFDGKRVKCHCASQSRPGFDYFARSFLPEPDRYSVLVIDANNNEIIRIGHYGNVDDGVPLIREGGPPNPQSIGGDEVALMHPQMLAVESDRRLFIGDLGNARIASVLLGYHAEAKVALKDVPDQQPANAKEKP